MNLPRIGVSLPHFGPHAGPDRVATVARAAERLGFHTVSVSERHRRQEGLTLED